MRVWEWKGDVGNAKLGLGYSEAAGRVGTMVGRGEQDSEEQPRSSLSPCGRDSLGQRCCNVVFRCDVFRCNMVFQCDVFQCNGVFQCSGVFWCNVVFRYNHL